ncbi:hypothetical protein [Psychromonas aquimarina]|uniref:hypothetical protein n=1 Tax=Psychromonas aquimarina TaxID=444919 RepID=UPI00048C1A67|nr:hypothetical protein [Psychromonas aquimarina]
MNTINCEIKMRLVADILKSWGEDLHHEDDNERLKQEIRVCTPTLRIKVTLQVFEERSKYFEKCSDYHEMATAIKECKAHLAKQIELGNILFNSGFYYQLGDKKIEQSPQKLKEALDSAVNDSKEQYSLKTLEDLESELPNAVSGIKMFAELYD